MDYQEDVETAIEDNGQEKKVTQKRLKELHQILEREWDAFERSSKTKTHRRRSSTESKQKPFSSIQLRLSPSQETWNTRNNALTLKRRLFEEEDEMGSATMADMFSSSAGSGNNGGSQPEEEALDLFFNRRSRSSTASSLVDETEKKDETRREKTAAMAEERSSNNGGQRFKILTWFAAAVTSVIFGFCIFSGSKIGENEEILVPT